MGFRNSPWATGVLFVAAVVLMSSCGWAVYYELGPSADEWGLKYEGDVTATPDGKLNVHFTLADQGRLKPIHSVHVFALTNPGPDGSRTYLLKAPMAMQQTADGKMTGDVQIDRHLMDYARVRIFSYTVDGQPQRMGVRYYDIPLRKLLKKPAVAGAARSPMATAPRTPAAVASPPVTGVRR